jgi:hypothetical protein
VTPRAGVTAAGGSEWPAASWSVLASLAYEAAFQSASPTFESHRPSQGGDTNTPSKVALLGLIPTIYPLLAAWRAAHGSRRPPAATWRPALRSVAGVGRCDDDLLAMVKGDAEAIRDGAADDGLIAQDADDTGSWSKRTDLHRPEVGGCSHDRAIRKEPLDIAIWWRPAFIGLLARTSTCHRRRYMAGKPGSH